VESVKLTLNHELVLGIDSALVTTKPDFLAAINLCIDLSRNLDNQIASELGIDQAQWSRIRKGIAHFPPNKLIQLMDFCGNEVPLQWLAIARHYELMPTLSSMEKRLTEKDDQIASLTQKLSHFKEFMAAK